MLQSTRNEIECQIRAECWEMYERIMNHQNKKHDIHRECLFSVNSKIETLMKHLGLEFVHVKEQERIEIKPIDKKKK